MRTKSGNGHSMNVEQFLDDIKAVVKDGEALLKAGASTVKERAVTGAKTTDRTVRQYPYQSMGIVFGLGVAVGMLALGLFTGGSGEEEENF